MENILKFYKVNNDSYGNPRYVVHYLNFLGHSLDADRADTPDGRYAQAVRIARAAGGTIYRGKDFGGGIAFQSYSLPDLLKHINSLCNNFYDGYQCYARGWQREAAGRYVEKNIINDDSISIE